MVARLYTNPCADKSPLYSRQAFLELIWMADAGGGARWDGVEASVVLDGDLDRVLGGNYEPCSHATRRVKMKAQIIRRRMIKITRGETRSDREGMAN